MKTWSDMSDQEKLVAYYTEHIQFANSIEVMCTKFSTQPTYITSWAEKQNLPVFDYHMYMNIKGRQEISWATPERRRRRDVFMDIAKVVSTRSTCLSCQVGAVVVVENRVVATGYNGAPSGKYHCTTVGVCRKSLFGFKHWDQSIPGQTGSAYEVSRSVHAEQSCVAQAAKFGIAINGGDIYCTRIPCVICQRLLINAGIKQAFYIDDDDSEIRSMDLEKVNI